MKTHFSIWSHVGPVYEDLEGWTEKQTPNSGEMCQNHDRFASKRPARNSAADQPEMHPAVQNRPWVPHAGGQDDGS